MRRFFAVAASFTSLGMVLGFYLRGGSPTANAGQQIETCAAKNGDVNADGTVDVSDAVVILRNLFLGIPAELVPLCAPPLAPAGKPATGQNVCYGNVNGRWQSVACAQATCQGQDGQFAAGCPSKGRLTDNGDRTVTDNCTGLMWQKDTADVNGDGQSTDQDYANWCDALTYCEDLEFAGHDDWRLPNVRELQSIVDYGRFSPASDPVFGPWSSFYWSSTSYALAPDRAWVVLFFDGLDNGYDDKATLHYVRAVRPAP